MIHPVVYNTSEILSQVGVKHAVLSPGSRNAPLTISFARNNKIKKWVIPDERAAGFIALGIAQTTKEPVVLVCTSGTAVLNYAPAVTEAFYREIPLIVLSADRPLELIDQRDGQTIRQFGVLRNHVKNSYQLPQATNQTAQEYLNKLVEASMFAKELPLGPVHLNIPFKEPFYPSDNQELKFVKTEVNFPIEPRKTDGLPSKSDHKKILFLIGQKNPNAEEDAIIEKIQRNMPVLVNPLSNVEVENCISYADLFLDNQEELKPDLLITYGLSVLSKRLKNYLRKHKPIAHWHLDPAGIKVDTFGTSPIPFRTGILEMAGTLKGINPDTEFLASWRRQDLAAEKTSKAFIRHQEFSELTATCSLLEGLPSGSILHLGNSMPVRYAEMIGVKKGIEVYCNRGTSGIDGVTSTALGTALATPEKLNVLVTGDVSFLYDRNAFFHQHDVPNLRIAVMNNQGGGIFRLIDGPSKQPELESYFETRHSFTAKATAEEYGMTYYEVRDQQNLTNAIKQFFNKNLSLSLMEIFTEPLVNEKVYRNFRTEFS